MQQILALLVCNGGGTQLVAPATGPAVERRAAIRTRGGSEIYRCDSSPQVIAMVGIPITTPKDPKTSAG